MKTRLGVAAACLAVLGGCDGKLSASGGCSDADTLATLRKVIEDNSLAAAGQNAADADLIRQGWASGKVPMAVDAIRTVKKDEAVKRSTCNAVLSLPFPQAAFERLAGNLVGVAVVGAGGMKRAGDALAVDIEYTSQPTDDGKQVYVELQRGDLIARAAGAVVFLATAPVEAPPAAAPPPVAAAPVTAAPDVPAAPTASANTGGQPAGDDLCRGLDTSITADMLDCLDRRFKAADAELNDRYRALMAGFPEARKNELRAEQRAWLAEKTKTCKAAGAEHAGGTAADVAHADCEVQRTQERVSYLAGLK